VSSLSLVWKSHSTQIWEDPEADLAALRLPVGSTIVTISSGGCNALSYLTARPAQVYAVDLNEAHLSLLQLKLAGSAIPWNDYSWKRRWLFGVLRNKRPMKRRVKTVARRGWTTVAALSPLSRVT
jgi:hypothetical protein